MSSERSVKDVFGPYIVYACQTSRIRTRANLECERGSLKSIVQRRRDNVVKRGQPESFRGVQQAGVLCVRVVVTEKNAGQDAAEKPVNVLFPLCRLVRKDELRHLSIRAIVLRLGGTAEKLIELLKVNLPTRRRPVEPPDEPQHIPACGARTVKRNYGAQE
jgi:hypothetical protein